MTGGRYPSGRAGRAAHEARSGLHHPATIPNAKLKVLSLFAGIGGFDLGLERTGGFETVAFCEINEFCQRLLAHHWPGVPIYDDVKTLSGDRLRADGIAVDVICGGFPCQDLSTSGSKLGLAGERSGLWFEYLRLAREIRPSFIIVENSPELLDRWMGDILGALASLGYDAEWHCIPASAVGAPHHRDRVWIIANAAGVGQPQSGRYIHRLRPAPDAYREANHLVDAFQRGALPFVCGGHDGPTGSVDELTALGNAVVPQIPELIGRAILASLQTQQEGRMIPDPEWYSPDGCNAPEPDIDVCMACGRYFAWTDMQAELAAANYPGEPYQQQCISCLRAAAPPEEAA